MSWRFKYLTGIDGVYAMLDKDNTLYVGGSQQVVAYGDAEPGNPDSAIEVKRTSGRSPMTAAFQGIWLAST